MDEKWMDALDELRDDYIMAAAGLQKKPRRGLLHWLPAVAAVLALAILIGALLYPKGPASMENPAKSTAGVPLFSAPATLGDLPPYSSVQSVQLGAISLADYTKLHYVHESAAREQAEKLRSFFDTGISRILTGAQWENVTFSPLNLYMALAVTAELSGGNAQILQLLQVDTLQSLRTQANQVWNACYRDDHNKCLLANAVWLQNGLQFQQNVLDALAENLYASSFGAEFGTEATDAAIRAWLDEQTGNLLQEQTAKIQTAANTVFALYSTVYYRAKWDTGFSSKNNTQAVFHGEQDTLCTYMNRQITATYYWGDDYGMVGLRLKDGSTMWLILPDADKKVDDVLRSGAYLDQIYGSGENQNYVQVKLSLPKFDINSSGDLKTELQGMGITDIFEGSKDCFAGFLRGDMPMCVSGVNYAARVAIDEEGVTAASYIEMPTPGAALPPEEIVQFTLDRPFLFVITDQTHLPLFAGVVNDPS